MRAPCKARLKLVGIDHLNCVDLPKTGSNPVDEVDLTLGLASWRVRGQAYSGSGRVRRSVKRPSHIRWLRSLPR
jgi:hypothetical protein